MRKLFTLLTLYLLLSVAYGQIPTNGLVAYYPMNGNANDASGNGNDGIVNGPVLTSDKFGNPNSAYSFDGVNDLIVVNDAPSLNNDYLGASFWVRQHGQNTANQYYLYKATVKNGTNEEYAANINYLSANNIGFSVKTGGHCTQPGLGWNHNHSLNNIYDNAWHHIAITYDGSYSRFYLDGNLISQMTFPLNTMDQCPGGVLLIGVKWGMVNFLDADLDNIRIYDRALSQAEVSALFNETPCPGSSISGNVSYDNAPANTPLSCSKVYLTTLNGMKTDSTWTDQSGNYQFCGVAAGSYKFSVRSNTAWGGVNSADALIALKHFAHLLTLTGNKFRAGDVNLSSYINSMDALIISRRFTGSIKSFAAGDWVFENPQVSVTGSASQIVQNIKGICTGDVNTSYLPPIISVSDAGTDQLNVPGNTVALNANEPYNAETGTWTILSGAGGSFSDIHDPQAIFSGQNGVAYSLSWTITNPCFDSSSDTVVVTFASGEGK